MGYTRYYEYGTQKPEKFEKFVKVAEQLKEAYIKETGVQIADGYGETLGGEVYDKTVVSFNGYGDEAHETLLISHTGEDFSFTKTARKPYDGLVNMTLELATKMLDGFSYSSDGENGDEENLEFLNWFLRNEKIEEVLEN